MTYIDPLGLHATICLYSGGGGFGHVGIGINSPTVTKGYYPNSDAEGNLITGKEGIVKSDVGEQKSCKTITTTPEQDSKMLAKISSVESTPGTYTLTGNNCVNFVREVLEAGGIASSDAIRPKPFFNKINGG